MKKILLFAAIAAALSLASCQKEGLVETGEDPSIGAKYPVFTAAIGAWTKTVVTPNDGEVFWESSDEITVIDAAKGTATYKIKGLDADKRTATFVIKSGKIGAGPYTATYRTEPAVNQDYSEIPGKLYMTAPETSNNSFSFTVQCGLLEINLNKSGESVKSVAVTGIPTGKSETTYTLTCTSAVNIESPQAFFIAVPAGSYNKIVIKDSEKKVCTLTASSGISVEANHIKPLTFSDDKLTFKAELPDGALPGVFSVSNTKQVYFSKGNLYWDGKEFQFEANQYDYKAEWDGSHVNHFYWSKTDSVTYVKFYKESGKSPSDVFFTNAAGNTAKSDFTVNGVTGKYRTLSYDEWTYLLGDKGKREDMCQDGVEVCGIKNCLILAPDNSPVEIARKYDAERWRRVQDSGLVCLPPAGYRDTSAIKNNMNAGTYWSSVAIDSSNAYCVSFTVNGIELSPSEKSRKNGYSVRLVTDVK